MLLGPFLESENLGNRHLSTLCILRLRSPSFAPVEKVERYLVAFLMIPCIPSGSMPAGSEKQQPTLWKRWMKLHVLERARWCKVHYFDSFCNMFQRVENCCVLCGQQKPAISTTLKYLANVNLDRLDRFIVSSGAGHLVSHVIQFFYAKDPDTSDVVKCICRWQILESVENLSREHVHESPNEAKRGWKKNGWQKTIESERRHPIHSLHIYTPYIKIRILHSLYIFQCERISMLFGPWIYIFIAFLAKVMAQNLPVFVMHYVAGWKIRSMFEAVALNRWEEAIQKHTMILDRILYVLLII